MSDGLKNRWNLLWQRLGAKGSATDVYDSIERSYGTPARAYHNLSHIEDCLQQLDMARHLTSDLESVELALWFHDVVYDSKAKDNEEQSATLASAFVKSAKLPPELGTQVSSLILATKHQSPRTDPEAALVVDVDLSILGRDGDVFDKYERQIREEYAWVDSESFKAGRVAVLQSFLARTAIYSTDYFRSKYETKARENLNRSLRALGVVF